MSYLSLHRSIISYTLYLLNNNSSVAVENRQQKLGNEEEKQLKALQQLLYKYQRSFPKRFICVLDAEILSNKKKDF